VYFAGWTVLQFVLAFVAIGMTALILLQGGKGEGLEALRGTKAEFIEGVTNPLRKYTAYFAAIFFVLVIILAGK
jgi:protein translocase SecG subunit